MYTLSPEKKLINNVCNIKLTRLNIESFKPYGDVLEPRNKPIDNKDLLMSGFAKMSNPVPKNRLESFDVLEYWGEIANITQEPMRLGYLRTKKRPLTTSWFERHTKGTQTFIPLGGEESIFVVAGPSKLDDPNDLPDLLTVKAFHLSGHKGVSIHPGTWHWTPFPINQKSDFIIVVRTNVKNDDLNFIDLESKLNTKINIQNIIL